MTHASHRLPFGVALLAAVAFGAAACGPAVSSPTPSTAASQTAPSFAATTPATPAPSATVVATPTPTASVPTVTPTASTAAVSCDLKPQTGTLPSDRLTGTQVLGLPGRDVVTFHFGNGSLTPAGPPVGSLEVARPPFTEGASGLPIDLKGEHALQVVFRGMALQNDVGQETYTGEREIRTDDPSRRLRHAIIFDESEGQIGWYIGYDGSTCVTLTREGDDVLVVIDYGPGS